MSLFSNLFSRNDDFLSSIHFFFKLEEFKLFSTLFATYVN